MNKYWLVFCLLVLPQSALAECALVTLTGNGSEASPYRPLFPPGIEKLPGFKWNAHIPSKPDGSPQYPDAYVCFPEGFKFPPGLAALPPGQAAAGILKRDPSADVKHMADIPPAVIKGSLRDYGERVFRLARYYLGVAYAWAASATDNFTGTGALSANWSSGYTGEGTPTRVSDAAECAQGVRCLASYNAFVPGANQYAQGVITQYENIGSDPGDAGVGVRMATPSTFSGYFARCGNFSSSTESTAFQKRISGANTSLGIESGSLLWAFGDTVRLEANGSALTLKRNGVTVLTASDSAPELVSGRGGIFLNSISASVGREARLDNFEVGDLAGAGTVAKRRVIIVQ